MNRSLITAIVVPVSRSMCTMSVVEWEVEIRGGTTPETNEI